MVKSAGPSTAISGIKSQRRASYRTSFKQHQNQIVHHAQVGQPEEGEVSRPIIPDGAFGNIRNILLIRMVRRVVRRNRR